MAVTLASNKLIVIDYFFEVCEVKKVNLLLQFVLRRRVQLDQPEEQFLRHPGSATQSRRCRCRRHLLRHRQQQLLCLLRLLQTLFHEKGERKNSLFFLFLSFRHFRSDKKKTFFAQMKLKIFWSMRRQQKKFMQQKFKNWSKIDQ